MRIKNNKAMFVNITILIDGFNGVEHGFIKSYGFAALIEINNKKILFDTGTKIQLLLLNFKTFGVSPSSLDAVILSHNHYDHTDGLPGILKENKNIPVYVHRDWGNFIKKTRKKTLITINYLNPIKLFNLLNNFMIVFFLV